MGITTHSALFVTRYRRFAPVSRATRSRENTTRSSLLSIYRAAERSGAPYNLRGLKRRRRSRGGSRLGYDRRQERRADGGGVSYASGRPPQRRGPSTRLKIGRASCRERV